MGKWLEEKIDSFVARNMPLGSGHGLLPMWLGYRYSNELPREVMIKVGGCYLMVVQIGD